MTVSDSLQRSHTYSDGRRAARVPQNLVDSKFAPAGTAGPADLDRHTAIAGTVVRGERLVSPI
ncbi:hypothetical protein BN381_70110 [Candidatus Microthrix parvicella RN1]|uniref:Uncharacterized protein n=1 Tax=Candidatus Neomicrothrix parvicella RN1 TaxID=1229780 RepID=R4Z6L0_9ACTN|nr:hypothetical protein BN381_70110 [Candidatus Microthrix parvicella RN1]